MLFCRNVKPVTRCPKIESAAAKSKTFGLRFSDCNRPIFWSSFKFVAKQLYKIIVAEGVNSCPLKGFYLWHRFSNNKECIFLPTFFVLPVAVTTAVVF